jgi:UDP-N-acetyl-D-glucosamine dehydrogenase
MKGSLKKRMVNRESRVGVIGLGYVGIPLAVAAAQAGFSVVGIDRSQEILRKTREGRHDVGDIDPRNLKSLITSGSLEIGDDPGSIDGCEIICICVPTPLNTNREPVLEHIREASADIAESMRREGGRERLVILESTSFPGTTHEVVLSLLERSGAKLCKDFHLAFSPERIDPGNRNWNLRNTPKLVGGEKRCCTELATLFYRHFVERVVPVSSPEVAEMAKMLENVFRAVNIALVNELWMLCDRMDIDIWEVIEAASTKPFGFMPFYPGPGLGGHCIPVDPFYLAYRAREFDFPTEFIELAGKINMNMPYFVVSLISRELNKRSKSIRNSRVLVLGVSYKADVGDVRNTPASKIIKLLKERGARVRYHDPHVPELQIDGETLRSSPFSRSLLTGTDLALIHTAHSNVDYQLLAESGVPVIDTRNVKLKRKGR